MTDLEVRVIIVILILIDEVHHFLISSLTLLNVHLLAPFIDSIFEGGVDVITSTRLFDAAGLAYRNLNAILCCFRFRYFIRSDVIFLLAF